MSGMFQKMVNSVLEDGTGVLPIQSFGNPIISITVIIQTFTRIARISLEHESLP